MMYITLHTYIVHIFPNLRKKAGYIYFRKIVHTYSTDVAYTKQVHLFPKYTYTTENIYTGWWFGTFCIFHNIWVVILPID